MSKRMIDYKVVDGKITSIDGMGIGAGGGIEVVNAEVITTSNGSTYNPKWIGNEVAPKPLTAYQVGDKFRARSTVSFNSVQVEKNQIFVPIASYLDSSIDPIKSGDVIMIPVSAQADVKLGEPLSANLYKVYGVVDVTYIVIKAGTTGDAASLALPSAWYQSYNYVIYTLK